MTELAVTKLKDDGRVYAQYTFGDGHVVVEKLDPRISHNAPASVTIGSTITITFTIVDFDEEPRGDSGGVLLLDIDGVDVPLTINGGSATLTIELHASASIKQQPPYFCEARMEPFVIEVAA